MAVQFNDIVDAFDFVSFGEMYTHEAYYCRTTGKFFFHSEFGDDVEPLPDDLGEDKYVCIPHKSELDLGRRLVKRFAAQHLSEEDAQQVAVMFSRKGAYSRFKDFLLERDMLEQWYHYEDEAQQKALREWCQDNEIDLKN